MRWSATWRSGARSTPERRARLTFAAILLATLLAALDQTIVATALPAIVNDLQGFSDLHWVVTAYLLTSTVSIPLYGKLSDLYGRRRLFVGAVSLFLLGSLLCGLAQSMASLSAFRALQGLGAGGLLPLAQATVGDLFSPRERGRYQGWLSGMWGVAAVAGPLVGGTLTDAASWRWIFLVNLPVGAVMLAIVIRTMPNPVTTSRPRLDIAGAIVLAAAVVVVLIGPVVAGVALLGVFVLVERRAREPILPLGLFRGRTFAVSVAANVVLGGVIFAVTIFAPVYLQGTLGESATVSGAVLITFSVGWFLSSLLSGRAIAHTGRYRLSPIVGAALVSAGAGMLAIGDPTPTLTLLAVALAVMGIGMGAMAQTYVLATQNAVAQPQLGTATAALQFFRTIGGALTLAGLGALLAATVTRELTARLGDAAERIDRDLLLQGGGDVPAALADHARAALGAGMHGVWIALLVFGLAALVLAILLEELPLHDQAPGGPSRSAALTSR